MTDRPLLSCLRAGLLALAIVAGVAAPAAPALAARESRGGDFIVAVVNTELVTAFEVAQRAERIIEQARRAGGAVPDAEQARQQALDALIDERVLVTYARDAGVKIDDADLDRATASVAAQNQLTLAQLRDRLRSEGIDPARFRSNLRDQLLVERVREREVLSRISVSDAEIDKLIDEHRAKAAADVQYDIAQILVTVPEGASDAVVAERRARAEAALARVRAGEDFAKVAREFSEDANREAGGEIGLRSAERLPELFVDAARGMAVGQVSAQPLRSAAGFHILKLLDRQQADPFKVTQTHARHILLRLSDPTQAAAATRRLEDVRRKIERGELSFEDASRDMSEDASASLGGDLGWASPGQFVPEFEEAMDKLPVGGISEPVVSRFGVHLIQVVERRSVTLDPKAVREQARNQLRERKYERAYDDWVKELRLRAYIEMREPPA